MLFYHRHLFWSRLVITLVFIPCVVTVPAAISLPPSLPGGRAGRTGYSGRAAPPRPSGNRCEGCPDTPHYHPGLPRPRLGMYRSVWFGLVERPPPIAPASPGPGYLGSCWRGAPGAVRGSGGAPVQEGAGGRKCRSQFSINPDTSKVNKAGQGRASREGREEASDRRLSRAEPGLFPARE